MIHLTKPQRRALKAVFERVQTYNHDMTYRTFRRSVQPGSGCVMVHFAGMWLGIEPDGLTHS